MSALPADTVSDEQPWPGLMPFSEGAQAYFHGRETEAAELFRLIRRETVTVLFGQSGLGKSSLLNAGLFPLLRAEDFFPVYVRLDVSEEAPAFVEQLFAALDAACAAHRVEAPKRDPRDTLWEFFHRRESDFWSSKNRLLTPVLVFDQFEEIFTLGNAAEALERKRVAFLRELADLAEDRLPASAARRIEEDAAHSAELDYAKRNYKLVLSFREDYLADFEGLRVLIPHIMQNRMRLARMNGTQAREAVLKSGRRLLSGPVADQIIRFVASPGAARLRAGEEELERLDVEPALLSVVCRELNNKRLKAGAAQITPDLLVSGAQHQIIREFYESSLAGMDPRVREFVEDQLLTEAGYRDSYALDDAAQLPGVSREAIDALVAKRLLRLEDRSGMRRVELTHDVLTKVAKESRDLRQRRIAEERDLERERQRRARVRRIAIVAAVAGLASIGLAVTFGVLLTRANEEKRRLVETQSNVLLEQASAQLEQDVSGSAQATLAEAIRLNPANNGAVGRAVAYLSERAFPTVTGSLPPADPGPADALLVDERAHAILRRGKDATFVVTDAGSGAVIGRPLPLPSQPGPLAISANRAIAAWVTGPRVSVATLGEGGSTWVDEPSPPLAIALSGSGSRILVRTATHASVYEVNGARQLRLAKRIASPGTMATLSPDGARVATLERGLVVVHDVDTDRSVALEHPLPVNTLEFSPDGTRLLTASQDKYARLWNVRNGELVGSPMRHDGAVITASYSAGGSRIVTASLDGTARVWDASNARLAFEPLVVGGPVRDARLNEDATRAVTLDAGGKRKSWSLQPARPAAPLADAKAPVTRVAPSRDGTRAFVASADGLSAWRVVEAAEGARLERQWSAAFPEATALALSADGKWLAAGSAAGAQLFEAQTGKPVGAALRHRGRVDALAFSADGTLLASGASDGLARIWKVATQLLTGTPLVHPEAAVTLVAFGPGNDLLATAARGAKGTTATLWALADGSPVATLAAANHVAELALARPGELLVFADTFVARWAISGAKSDAGMKYSAAETARLRFGGVQWSAGLDADRSRAVVGGLDGTSRIVDLQSLRPVGEAMRSVGVVESVGFSADGRWIVTRSADRVARIWEATGGRAVSDGVRHSRELAGAALMGGGRYLASFGRDATASVRMVGLDFRQPPPEWLPRLVEIAGGARIDDVGSLNWIEDREKELTELAQKIAQDTAAAEGWKAWARNVTSRLGSGK